MMASKCVWVKKLLLFMFVFVLNENCWSEGCPEEERLALFQLKHFSNNPYRLKNWREGDENSDCCLWEGVECSNTTGRVRELNLAETRNWELGEWYLNASLFSPFQELERLDLRGNNIAGFVEKEGLSSLTNLKFLNLGFNMFNNSTLSSLDGLSSLTTLSLTVNRFEGSIDIKDSWSNLQELDLSGNEIEKFVFPKGFGSLKFLKKLDLSDNQLREIKNLNGLSKLEFLDLSYNTLNRSIFSSLTGISSLQALHLLANGLEGTFDIKELDSLSKLKVLDLSLNAIDKFVVPKDYRGLRKLNSLYLEGVGNISDGSTLLHSLGSFPSLKTLDLGYNIFTGTILIPKDLQNFTNLEDLTLDGSLFHISLLQSLTAFGSLKHLSMQGCKLHGISKFQGLCELVHLEELYISNNDLVGILPWCLANMRSLRVLDVSSNQLTGNIFSSPLI